MSKNLALSALRTQLTSAKETVTNLKAQIKREREGAAAEKMLAYAKKKVEKEARIAARWEKTTLRIAKMEAKLLALKTGPVGIKAVKAAKRPSKVIITKMAA